MVLSFRKFFESFVVKICLFLSFNRIVVANQ